jgi:hypothetical protein
MSGRSRRRGDFRDGSNPEVSALQDQVCFAPQVRTSSAPSATSEKCRYCCKSPERLGGHYPAEKRKKRQSPVDIASNPIPESPISLARDVVPHIVNQSSHLRLGEFSPCRKKTFATVSAMNRHGHPNSAECFGRVTFPSLTQRILTLDW